MRGGLLILKHGLFNTDIILQPLIK